MPEPRAGRPLRCVVLDDYQAVVARIGPWDRLAGPGDLGVETPPHPAPAGRCSH